MMIGRLIGWALTLVGVALLAHDVIAWLQTDVWAPLVLGQLWYDLDRGSLNLAQAVVQRYVDPYVWDPVITSLLFCWGFAVFIGLGLLIRHLFRRRTPRRS